MNRDPFNNWHRERSEDWTSQEPDYPLLPVLGVVMPIFVVGFCAGVLMTLYVLLVAP